MIECKKEENELTPYAMSHLCGKVQLVSCYHRHELANLIICTQLEFMYLLLITVICFSGDP